jgi:hypothetical protein
LRRRRALSTSATHRLGRGGEEMAATVPALHFIDVHEPEISFMNHRRSMQRLSRLLLHQSRRRKLAQRYFHRHADWPKAWACTNLAAASLRNVVDDRQHA